MSRWLVLACTVAAGCAWGDGDYFTVVDAQLRANLAPAAGVELDRFELHADELVLAAAAGEDDDAGDDGHAHRVIAALAPDQVEVLGLEVGAVDLLDGADRALDCEGSCGIATATTIESAQLLVSRVVLTARVPDGAGGAIDLDLDADAGGLVIEAALDLVVDRHIDATSDLTFELDVDAAALADVRDEGDLVDALAGISLHVTSHDHEHE